MARSVIERCAERDPHLVAEMFLTTALGAEAVDEGLNDMQRERSVSRELGERQTRMDLLGTDAPIEPVKQVFGHFDFDVAAPPEIGVSDGCVVLPLIDHPAPGAKKIFGRNARQIGGVDPQLADNTPCDTCPLLYVPGAYRTQFKMHRLGCYTRQPLRDMPKPCRSGAVVPNVTFPSCVRHSP